MKIIATTRVRTFTKRAVIAGDFNFLWENWKYDPCKIETLEQIDYHTLAQ